MELNKKILWSILEKYDCLDYKGLCDSLSNIIQNKSTGDDLLVVYTYLEKIQTEDRLKIENQIGNKITEILFSI